MPFGSFKLLFTDWEKVMLAIIWHINAIMIAFIWYELLYNIEDGVNADGNVLTSFIESGDGDIADGEEFSFIDKIIPDFKNQAGNATITLRTRDYPNDTLFETTNVVVNSSTRFNSVRARGRQVALRIQSNDLNDNWRFGTFRINVNADGKR